jgi:short subunit dehydrogenase-like uncharacterized protein
MSAKKYDIVIHGATGFTGRLVAQHFAKHYPPSSGVKWCMAGRNKESLDGVKTRYGIDEAINVHVCDINDASSLDSLFGQAEVVIACAGPFINIGLPIVSSCVRMGVNYVDITGESSFVKKTIDSFHEDAVKKKIKIVSCCGFDCIPADVGCDMMMTELMRREADPVECTYNVIDINGGVRYSIITLS